MRRFVEWAQNEIAVVPDFHKRILFSDEAHFWLNGYINKQNCRIWSEANPQVYVEIPLHPEKLTAWCALWAGGIIGPYFFKNDEDHNVTVNGDRYRAMITNFFIPELNNHDVQELWFQQDGATCHTARATIGLLKDTFGDRLISRFGPVNWPPRFCDLTPLDYFLWGYLKSLVSADKPQTLDHLEDNIRRVFADIRPQITLSAEVRFEDFGKQCVLCLRLVSLHVPSKVIVGDVIKLTCRYDLEGDTLYSIKWYRDDVEFFRTQIRPVLTYASGTWTITKLEENRIVSFEEKILRSVLEGVSENNSWRR
ncbi:putative DD41D transposase [Trichonephila clavipes]|nr:putative DD41D transposase [Trichonephila clavipes]